MKRRRLILMGVALFVVICVFLLIPASNSERKAVDETRRLLKKEGFKTDLTEFDFSTSPEMRARVSAITNAIFLGRDYRRPQIMPDTLTTMRAVGANSALVIWKEDKIGQETDPANGQYLDGNSWGALRQKFEA